MWWLRRAFLWKSFLANFTLMRVLFGVDGLDVKAEIAFLWKSFLANFTLMRLLFGVDGLDVMALQNWGEASLLGGLAWCEGWGYISMNIFPGEERSVHRPVYSCNLLRNSIYFQCYWCCLTIQHYFVLFSRNRWLLPFLWEASVASFAWCSAEDQCDLLEKFSTIT